MQSLSLISASFLPPPWLRAIAFLYLGPETVMPLTSALAAVLGVLLIFWRSMVGFFKRLFRTGIHWPQQAASEGAARLGEIEEV